MFRIHRRKTIEGAVEKFPKNAKRIWPTQLYRVDKETEKKIDIPYSMTICFIEAALEEARRSKNRSLYYHV